MAAAGMNIVEAINELVETIGEFPMSGTTVPSALSPADTTSIYYRAEQFIDRENTRVQSQGWPENTILNRTFTAKSGSANDAKTIPLLDGTANTDPPLLRVRPAGKDKGRNLVSVVTTFSAFSSSAFPFLFDSDNEMFQFFNVSTSGTVSEGTVELDVVVKRDFANISPLLQDVIIAGAKMKFQRRLQGNPEVDQQLLQEYMMAEYALDRNSPILKQTFNVQPLVGNTGEQK